MAKEEVYYCMKIRFHCLWFSILHINLYLALLVELDKLNHLIKAISILQSTNCMVSKLLSLLSIFIACIASQETR
jgi:hypothetical protein